GGGGGGEGGGGGSGGGGGGPDLVRGAPRAANMVLGGTPPGKKDPAAPAGPTAPARRHTVHLREHLGPGRHARAVALDQLSRRLRALDRQGGEFHLLRRPREEQEVAGHSLPDE